MVAKVFRTSPSGSCVLHMTVSHKHRVRQYVDELHIYEMRQYPPLLKFDVWNLMRTILDPDVRTFFPSGDYEEPGTTILGMVEVVMTRLSWTIPTCQQEPNPDLGNSNLRSFSS